MPEDQQQKWEGLFRGSVLSTAIQKHVSYLLSADTRAQGLILLNSALVPLALNGMRTDDLRTAATICALTSLLTITLCIFCLYPKRLAGRNLLHYVQFSRLTEEQFMDEMRGLFADKDKMAEAAVRGLYHLGSKVVRPEWLFRRLAWAVFLGGQLSAALLAVASR